jgi:hypothetical protein
MQRADLDDLGQRQCARPRSRVNVPSHGKRGRDTTKALQDLGVTNVAGVKYQL